MEPTQGADGQLIQIEVLIDSSSLHHDHNCEGEKASKSLIGEPDFGLLFDVDGVLARGSKPLAAAVRAFQRLKDQNGALTVPCAFVTNSCNRAIDKARQIAAWFGIEVRPDQVIHSPTPVKLLREMHDKFTLVIGQEYRLEIAQELGFKNLCTIEDIKEAYPLLDMVDHQNRVLLNKDELKGNPQFPRVEVILMIGEPARWETSLQLLTDLLLTEGKPVEAPADMQNVPQMPIIACNMDLVFMAEACMPRFGNGAFLVCLEALYKKLTGREIEYMSLVGKPCEITYRFAEHTIAKEAQRMGIKKPIKRLYFFGDNPQVDIMGANLYDRYIKQTIALSHLQSSSCETSDSEEYSCPSPRHARRSQSNSSSASPAPGSPKLPSSRIIPTNVDLHQQTVEQCLSMLVGTGVYKHGSKINRKGKDGQFVYHGHRDIEHEPQLTKPHKYVPDVLAGIEYILDKESSENA